MGFTTDISLFDIVLVVVVYGAAISVWWKDRKRAAK